MAKTIIKEFFILLLLCIAIILILGVIFYDYIPTNKAVPNPIAPYSTPENIKSEIEEKINAIEQEQQTLTYTITGADLNLYKQSNSYIAGKPDPFAASTSISTPNTNTAGNNSGNNSNSNNNNNSENQNNSTKPENNSNSTGTFFNNTGLK